MFHFSFRFFASALATIALLSSLLLVATPASAASQAGDGAPTPAIRQAFIDAYNRQSGNIVEFTNQVHTWDKDTAEDTTALVQNFQESAAWEGGIGSIVYNPNENKAYVLHGAIENVYSSNGGPLKAWVGYPIGDETVISSLPNSSAYYDFKQTPPINLFEHGFIAWPDGASGFQMHTYYPTVDEPSITATMLTFPNVRLNIQVQFKSAPGYPNIDPVVVTLYIEGQTIPMKVAGDGVTATASFDTQLQKSLTFAIELNNTSHNTSKRGSYPLNYSANKQTDKKVAATNYHLGNSPNGITTYWQKWDLDITKRALDNNISPSLVKSIIAQETYGFNTSVAKNYIYAGKDPRYSMFYEIWNDRKAKNGSSDKSLDYNNPWTKKWLLSKDNTTNYQACYGIIPPNVTQNESTHSPTMGELYSNNNYNDCTYIIGGTSFPSSDSNATAQYRAFSSYGLGHFYYNSEFCILGGCNLENNPKTFNPARYDPAQTAPPETFYDDQNSLDWIVTRLTRERTDWNPNLNQASSIDDWATVIGCYNGCNGQGTAWDSGYVPGVKNWYSKTQPIADVVRDANAASLKPFAQIFETFQSLNLKPLATQATPPTVVAQTIADITGDGTNRLITLEQQVDDKDIGSSVVRIYENSLPTGTVQWTTPATFGIDGVGSFDVIQTSVITQPLLVVNLPIGPHAFITRIFVVSQGQLQELKPDTAESSTPGFYNDTGPAIVMNDGAVFTRSRSSFPQRNFTYNYQYDQGGFTLVDVVVEVLETSSYADTTAPTSFVQVTGTKGNVPWYISPITVKLWAIDDLSGVRETNYRINGGAWQKYQTPLTIATEGVTNLEFYSVDNANNTETVRQKIIKIDTHKPSSSVTPSFNNWILSLAFNVTDPIPGSGPEGLHYVARSLNGNNKEGLVSGASGTFQLEGPVYEVEYWATDIAGNQEAHRFIRIVVSEADTDTPGTLRYALNHAQDNETIYFNIPGTGVHTIKVKSLLPAIKQNGLTIDATSQNGTVCGTQLNAAVGGEDKIVIGLEVTGSNFKLSGLNLHSFSGQILWLNNTEQAGVTCTFIGTNAIGSKAVGGSQDPDQAKPIGLRITDGKGGHIIGGSENGQGVLIAGDLFTLVKIEHSPNNKLIGNTIGTDRDGKKLLGDPEHGENKQGVLVAQGSDGTVIDNNLLAGQVTSSVRIVGSGNVQLTNNIIGADRTMTKGLAQTIYDDEANIAHVVLEGGTKQAVIKGNILSSHNYRAILVADTGTDDNLIENNWIGVNPKNRLLTSEDAGLLGSIGIWVKQGPKGTQIKGNVLGGLYTAIQITGKVTTKTTVKGNSIGLSTDGKVKLPNIFGVWIFDGASDNLVTENVIANGEEAVKIGTEPQDAAVGNTVSQNSMFANSKGGVVHANGNYESGVLNGEEGWANRNAARPNRGLIVAKLDGANLTISGKAKSVNFNSTVEVFISSGNSEFPQGKTYLGTVKAVGDGSFSLNLPATGLKKGMKLVLTSTLPTGDTSAFSSEVTLN